MHLSPKGYLYMNSEVLTIESALSFAKKAIKKNDLYRAKQLYEAVLANQPNNNFVRKKLKKLLSHKFFEKIEDSQKQDPSEKSLNEVIFLIQQGELISAKNKCKNLIENFNTSFKLHSIYGEILIALEEYNEAKNVFLKCISLNSNNPNSYNNLGVAHKNLKNIHDAKLSFEQAITIQPDFYIAHNNLAHCYNDLNFKNRALESFFTSLEINRQNSSALGGIVSLLREGNIDVNQNNLKFFKKVFSIILINNTIDINSIWPTYIKILPKEEINTLLNIKNPILSLPLFKEVVFENLFLMGLRAFSFQDPTLELFLTRVRSELLNYYYENREINFLKSFIFSLAKQCFLNEYVYIVYKRDKEIISKLKERLIISKKIDEDLILVLSCYEPLGKLFNFSKSITNFKSSNIEFNDLVRVQVLEPKIEENIKNQIETLGSFKDNVSREVKSHYEDNPYPRWNYAEICSPVKFLNQVINNDLQNNILELNSSKKDYELLIAGCGTGSQVVNASRYGGANITAIDLSKTSIGYAKRKYNDLGLKNVKFFQADILELENLNKKFDVIECCGVLHHMENPLEGLKTLLNILEPGGFIKIGLYSELARRFVTETRKYINIKKYTDSSEDMRQCREDIINNCHENNLSSDSIRKLFSTYCFWNLSGTRDLMFHKHEIRYTIDQIKTILEKFDLEFLGFVLQKDIKDAYFKSYEEDKNLIDLNCWSAFEELHPEIFGGMYQFWIKNK